MKQLIFIISIFVICSCVMLPISESEQFEKRYRYSSLIQEINSLGIDFSQIMTNDNKFPNDSVLKISESNIEIAYLNSIENKEIDNVVEIKSYYYVDNKDKYETIRDKKYLLLSVNRQMYYEDYNLDNKTLSLSLNENSKPSFRINFLTGCDTKIPVKFIRYNGDISDTYHRLSYIFYKFKNGITYNVNIDTAKEIIRPDNKSYILFEIVGTSIDNKVINYCKVASKNQCLEESSAELKIKRLVLKPVLTYMLIYKPKKNSQYSDPDLDNPEVYKYKF